MECNKEEAARAKELAEKKLTERDYDGAKKIALKAQTLFPGLEGLPQFMATLDLYISSEKKVNGEVDWYGILGVDPFADDETLRRQYRALALTLHPDKNKSVGADGAFKILSEAWSLLSDEAKRGEYNQKRNLRVMNQKNTSMNAPMPAGKNGFHGFTHSGNSSLKDLKSGATLQPTPSKSNTFWTACKRCKMQYEYLREYLNYNLRCPNCHEPFCAVEIPRPPRNGQIPSTQRGPYQQQQNVNDNLARNMSATVSKPISAPNAGAGCINSPNIQQGTHLNPGGVRIVPGSGSSAGQSANLFHPASQSFKKSSASQKMGARSASHVGSSSGKVDRPLKKSRIDMNVAGRDIPNKMAMGNGGIGQRGSSGTARFGAYGTVKQKSVRWMSQLEIRNALAAKSRMELRKKLKDWSMEAALKESNKVVKEAEMEKSEVTVNGGKKDGNKSAAFMDRKANADRPPAVQPRESSTPAISNIDTDEKPADVMLMSVPDPEFYDFDKDRIEKSFGENQVWAAYDDDDGMPRYYALIHSLISKRPFKLEISWLNSKSNAELGPLNWIGSGFSKTTGDFRIGKRIISKNLNSFSHRMKWTKAARGVIQIFPKKGDVWALFKNWSPDWNELTKDEVIHKYDMVEVLDDYHEERGVAVCPLVKVAGFKSVFHQHFDPGEVKTIRREEMFRFSHHVPSYIITGQEAANAPRGCLELDPAALPLELLQVITEAKEVETAEKATKATKEGAVDGLAKVEENLHLQGSGRSSAQEGLTNRYKYVYTKRKARKGKESTEEEIAKHTNEATE